MDTPDPTFTIWIDADGIPGAVKEIVFRAARRLRLPVVLVANRWQQIPPGHPTVRQVVVGKGLDVADDAIVERCKAGDIVITGDVPLAAQVVDKGAVVLQHRGELLDASNVRQRLAMRDFMEELRAGGTMTGGPPPFGRADRQSFADALDRLLTRKLRGA
ncbi:MAG: YaiI/YqxD family protein [Deltaproteobacteria bacterium]|nr:MAG: YaiI/YqxD family protein [Deltaproteobacteria bacterium]